MKNHPRIRNCPQLLATCRQYNTLYSFNSFTVLSTRLIPVSYAAIPKTGSTTYWGQRSTFLTLIRERSTMNVGVCKSNIQLLSTTLYWKFSAYILGIGATDQPLYFNNKLLALMERKGYKSFKLGYMKTKQYFMCTHLDLHILNFSFNSEVCWVLF